MYPSCSRRNDPDQFGPVIPCWRSSRSRSPFLPFGGSSPSSSSSKGSALRPRPLAGAGLSGVAAGAGVALGGRAGVIGSWRCSGLAVGRSRSARLGASIGTCSTGAATGSSAGGASAGRGCADCRGDPPRRSASRCRCSTCSCCRRCCSSCCSRRLSAATSAAVGDCGGADIDCCGPAGGLTRTASRGSRRSAGRRSAASRSRASGAGGDWLGCRGAASPGRCDLGPASRAGAARSSGGRDPAAAGARRESVSRTLIAPDLAGITRTFAGAAAWRAGLPASARRPGAWPGVRPS